MSRPKFHTLRVSDVRHEAADCISVAFEVPSELQENYRFQQGQYLTLRADINGEDVRRSYSICSGVNEGELRVAIKKVEMGTFSTWAYDNLKKGMEMQVMTPMGHFTSAIDVNHKKTYLLVAAGSGVTPIMSIAKTVLSAEPQSEVIMVYGNRHFNSIIFRDQLEDMKDRHLGRFRLYHVLSGEPNEIGLFHGRIDSEKIEGFCQSFIDITKVNEVFVCGPEPMIRAVKDYALEAGLPSENVHFELFATPGPTPQVARPVVEKKEETSQEKSKVSVIFDGQQVDFEMPFEGISILDAAQKNGLDIPFSCKGGMCCTCRAHVSEGKAEMIVNYALEPGEVEGGYVLTCQALPKSDRVVVDFDKP